MRSDVLERTLYNGLISGMSTDGKKFFYTNPLESDGKFLFNRGACTRQSWFDCSCCPTNMIRFLPSLAGLIYATNGDTVYTNLFISSDAHLKNSHGELKISQQTGYPWNGDVSIKVEADAESEFTLKIRVPGWLRNEVMPGNLYTYVNADVSSLREPSLKINGKDESVKISNGYITINKIWKKGDEVNLSLPMTVRKVITKADVQGNVNKIAFERGPIVYCAEGVDNRDLSKVVVADDITVEAKPEILMDQPVDVLTASNGLKLIPYYLWSNRGVNEMKVWFPTQTASR